MGSGPRGNIVGAVGGALIGGIASAMAEEAASRQDGMEYVVQTDNGALLTVVQGREPAFAVSQKVLVLYGSRSRIIPDPI